MTEKRIKTISLCLLCMSVWLMAGCIKEGANDCDITYTLAVKAYDAYNRELSSEEVSDVSLFVFDSSGAFIERMDTRTNEDVIIQVSPEEDLHLVTWGNVSDECHAYSVVLPGDPKDLGFVYLLPDPRSELYSLSPDDLFLGEKNISGKEQTGKRVILPIYRQVGSLTVTIRNLNTFTGYEDSDYSVVVRGTHSVLDFSGRLSGDKVAYRPAGSYTMRDDGKDEFYVPPLHLFPETNAISIDIYHGSQLITSVSENADGTPVTIQTDMLTNVLIELKATVSVSISLTPWGEEQVWKEF